MLKRYFVAHLIGICRQQRYRIGLIGLLTIHCQFSTCTRPTPDSPRHLRHLPTELPYLPRS